jgi:uncharacterized tellurite resistance protein B-like protein
MKLDSDATFQINQNPDYQMGLLYFIHLLVEADGSVDYREEIGIQRIKREEGITDELFSEFYERAKNKKEKEVYEEGVALLNKCSEEERLQVFVHLYQLAEADESIHEKEVRLLLYGVKATDIDFGDVKLAARMSKTRPSQLE